MRTIDHGKPFAFVFYRKNLHTERPACTFSFSHLYWSEVTCAHLERCETVNVLWRYKQLLPWRHKGFNAKDLKKAAAAQKTLEETYPDIILRGLFTENGYLQSLKNGTLKVVGPNIILTDFQNGPINRVDPPRRPGVRDHLRLVGGTQALPPKDIKQG